MTIILIKTLTTTLTMTLTMTLVMTLSMTLSMTPKMITDGMAMLRFLHTFDAEIAKQYDLPLDTVAVLMPEIFWSKAGNSCHQSRTTWQKNKVFF